jgi:hypothetical protein
MPGDFVETVTKVRDFEPEFLLTGHFGTVAVEPAFLDEALRRARSLEEIVWGLIAVPAEAGFALDPNWATLYPYQATARLGEPVELAVRIVNYLDRPATAMIDWNLPDGWSAEALAPAPTIAAGAQGEARFAVTPPTAVTGDRHVISASVTLDERRFGPVAEGIVRLVAPD